MSPYLGRGAAVILGRVGRRDDNDIEMPRAAGWYPDPWSATGDGERYFDGKKWGTNEKPFGRQTSVALEPPKHARSASGRVRRAAPFLVVILLIAAVYAIPKLRGSNDGNSAVVIAPETSTTPMTISADHPPASREEADAPLGTPAPVPAGPGKFEVLSDQPDDPSTPIAFDPCRPIHYVVNPAGAPPDGAVLLHSAIARIQTATGLHFVDDGATTEKVNKDRKAYQPGRYNSSRWAPVLFAWTDEDAYPDLAGYVEGAASPAAVYASSNRVVYVTGQIAFDRRDLSPARTPQRTEVRAVMLHELGHLVGLGHTSDRQEIMFSESQFNVLDYAAGDRRGLARLGTQACFPGV